MSGTRTGDTPGKITRNIPFFRVIGIILKLDQDGDTIQALKDNNFDKPTIMGIIKEADFSALRRTVQGKEDGLRLGDLRFLQTLYRYYKKVMVPIYGKNPTTDEWAKVTFDDVVGWDEEAFDAESTQSDSGPNTGFPKQVNPAESFQRGIKRDPSQYFKLTEDKHWDSWKMNVEALARVHGVYDVLDETHVPSDMDLYKEMSHYLFAVLLQTVQTRQGRLIVKP